VIDHQPRSWTSDQIETLKTLTAAVLSEIELARARTAA
jgi:GAF domain-containing protein